MTISNTKLTGLDMHETHIEKHYKHAKEKHPYFCDMLQPKWMTPEERKERIHKTLYQIRNDLKSFARNSNLMWDSILDCEVWEIHEAIELGDTDSAVEECYDAIAVLLRVVDVLRGRYELGNPKKKGKKR